MRETVSLSADEQNLSGGEQVQTLIRDEDQARSRTYTILASLLSDVPSKELIEYISSIESLDEEDLPQDSADNVGDAWRRLKAAARTSSLTELDDEYHALFVGLGRGEVVPYASWHLTGFLMDKPLGELRADLKALGFESDPERKEPEDHIAAICETMSILITADDIESYQQRRFYLQHIYSWAGKFFSELENAKNADFYRAVGILGQRFIALENQYLNIQDH
ncbi:MAG: molecular chaperone TorD family protein [Acidiferrobacterales bacterium]|nr:molecular chaperone TorD family protein [Acidiferrobacterales bacterium]